MQSDTYFRQNCSYSISSAWFVILTLSSLQFCSASSTPSCLKRTAQIICEPIYKLPLRPLPRVLHSCLLSGAPPSPTPGACCTLRGWSTLLHPNLSPNSHMCSLDSVLLLPCQRGPTYPSSHLHPLCAAISDTLSTSSPTGCWQPRHPAYLQLQSVHLWGDKCLTRPRHLHQVQNPFQPFFLNPPHRN